MGCCASEEFEKKELHLSLESLNDCERTVPNSITKTLAISSIETNILHDRYATPINPCPIIRLSSVSNNSRISNSINLEVLDLPLPRQSSVTESRLSWMIGEE